MSATPRPLADPFLGLSPRLVLRDGGRATLANAPEGYDAHLLSTLAREAGGPWLHVARDDARAQALVEALGFFAPDLPVLHFPAWDCLPYDRMSPKAEIASARMACLSTLASRRGDGALVVVTTVNALVQRLPARAVVATHAFSAHVGNAVDLDALTAFLGNNGYARASTVREPGEFAIRGGIVDLFPPGMEQPLRLDLFGDTLESVRPFDPESQRTTGQIRSIDLVPVSEVLLDAESIQRFRRNYVSLFGAVTDEDPLYEAVSAGHKYQGMEHWLPLFHENLETLFDYLPEAPVSLDHLAQEARDTRLAMITDHYEARTDLPETKGATTALSAPRYKPLPPQRLYLAAEDWEAGLEGRTVRAFNPFEAPESGAGGSVIDAQGRAGRNFAPERAQDRGNVFAAVADHIQALHKDDRRVVLACWTQGSAERMAGVLAERGIEKTAAVSKFSDVAGLPAGVTGLAVLGLEHGFLASGYAVIAEQDVLGDRLIRQRGRSRKAQNFLTEAAALSPGDLVVHVDHGIGRYEGLQSIDVQGAPHDCLMLLYHNNDKLFLPVENIELLSRYGSDDEGTQLDRLGGGA